MPCGFSGYNYISKESYHYFDMLSECWSLALRYGGTREFVGTLHLMKKDVCGGFYLGIERDRSIVG